MPRQLYVFGSNGECQLSIPIAEIVDNPTKVSQPPPLEELRTVAGGDNHTLFLTKKGDVMGVGANHKGQIADDEPYRPRMGNFVHSAHTVSFIAATCESSAYVVNDSDSSIIHTRGSGQWGELGWNDVQGNVGQSVTVPGPLPGHTLDFAAGVWHYVAVLEDGSVYGWGKARLGQLGPSLDGHVTSPTSIEGIPFKPGKVVCGKDFTYLVGDSVTGEHIVLGRDKFNIVSGMPPRVTGWRDIGATWHAIFVLFGDGTLTAWGRNTMWDLIPSDLPPIEKIAVGSEHVLALTREGKLLSWGWGKHGNCGNLSKIQHKLKNDCISGFWNEIEISDRDDCCRVLHKLCCYDGNRVKSVLLF
jgi:protein ATS1